MKTALLLLPQVIGNGQTSESVSKVGPPPQEEHVSANGETEARPKHIGLHSLWDRSKGETVGQ